MNHFDKKNYLFFAMILGCLKKAYIGLLSKNVLNPPTSLGYLGQIKMGHVGLIRQSSSLPAFGTF